MTATERIMESIYDAIEQLNQALPPERQLEKSAETVLFGKSGKLDSLGLVSLVVAVEEAIEEQYGVSISLADQRAMSQKRSPFRSIGSLAEYAGRLIDEM